MGWANLSCRDGTANEKPDEQGLFESNLLWITRTYISNSADVTAQSMPRYRTVGHGGPNGQMRAFSGMWGQQTGTLFPQQIFFQQQQQQPPVVVGQLAPYDSSAGQRSVPEPASVCRTDAVPGSTGVLAMNIGVKSSYMVSIMFVFFFF